MEFIKSPKFNKALINSIPVPIFYKGIDGKYLGCNTAFLELLGKTHDEVIGKTVYDIAPKEIAEEYDKKDKELLGNVDTQVYEWKIKNKEGNLRDVIFHKALFRDDNNTVCGLIGAILDITERKKSEKKLKEKMHQLEVFNKSAIDRELKMVELKNQVAKLEQKLAEKQ